MTGPRFNLARIRPLRSLYTPNLGLKTLSNVLCKSVKRCLSLLDRMLFGSRVMALENGILGCWLSFGVGEGRGEGVDGTEDGGVVTLRIVARC